MRDIKVTMTRKAYQQYMKPHKDGGGGIKNRKELIEYLNKTAGYRGRVVDVAVEADPLLKPKAKDEEDLF